MSALLTLSMILVAAAAAEREMSVCVVQLIWKVKLILSCYQHARADSSKGSCSWAAHELLRTCQDVQCK